MKSNLNTLTLIILGALFVFLPIPTANLNFNTGISGENVEKEKIQISALSGKIHIDGNSGWLAFRSAGNCTGNGTYHDPYVIENLEIDGGGSGSCILIENSTVYFRIEKCNLYNSGDYPAAGIKLNNTNNGQVTDNVCSPNNSGISLYASHNNTISGNIVDHNDYCGILLHDGDNNTISGNSIDYNSLAGIILHVGGAENNNITGNTLVSNQIGIQTWSFVRYNNITRNIISKNALGIEFKGGPSGNNDVYLNCFTDNGVHANDGALNNKWDNGTIGNYWDNYTGSDSDNNGVGEIPYNIAGPAGSQDNFPLMICPISTTQNGGRIPGFNLFMLIGILSVAVILIRMKLKHIKECKRGR